MLVKWCCYILRYFPLCLKEQYLRISSKGNLDSSSFGHIFPEPLLSTLHILPIVILNIYRSAWFSSPQEVQLNSPSLKCGLDLVTNFYLGEYGRSDGVWLLRQVHKRHCNFLLALSWLNPSWRSQCHVERMPRMLEQSCGEYMWQEKEVSCQHPWEWTVLEAYL